MYINDTEKIKYLKTYQYSIQNYKLETELADTETV